MSLWSYIFDSDLNQRADIEELKSHIHQSHSDRARMEVMEARLHQAQTDIGRLVLLVQAMARLLEEKKILPRNELADMIRAIDLEEGVEDQQITLKRSDICVQCARVLPNLRKRCMYCGHQNG